MFSSNTSQVSNDATYIEDVFSTYLYTGNGSTQTITNGIDLAGKGGLVWIKDRTTSSLHGLTDTVRGNDYGLASNATYAQFSWYSTGITAFNSNGFSLGNDTTLNPSGDNLVSWTFRKQPKFFDVQTATTNGSSSYGSTVPSMTITHSLGSVPGCVMVKRTDGTGDWYVWHRSLPALSGLAQTATYARLNTTDAAAIFGGNVNGTGGWIQVTATNIYLDAWFNTYEPGSFVIYIFAHNAGGFGLTGTDNVISCGSLTTSTPLVNVNLGYEPQWVMWKRTDATGNWGIADNMRGMPVSGNDQVLIPNLTNTESLATRVAPNSTGFPFDGGVADGSTFIYIAIRRGPMKTPTSGTSVFSPAGSAGATGTKITTDFPLDLQFSHSRSSADIWWWADRLRGMNSPGLSANSPYLSSDNTNAEATSPGVTNAWDNTSFSLGSAFSGQAQAYYNLRRAPGFFDEVCYTGDNVSGRTVQHNLGTAPDLVFVKCRSTAGLDWYAYGRTGNTNQLAGSLNNTWAFSSFAGFSGFTQQPTSQYLYLSSGADETNGSGKTYVAYLFGSVAGVSKVGTYTGTGATQTISCGFAARFVLIKRTDSTGSWWVWDTARGMVAGTDPRLPLNASTAETNANWVYTDASGFQIVTTDATVNASGGSYIYLAIA